MCLIIKEEIHSDLKPLIAKKDLFVFKIANYTNKASGQYDSCRSYYRGVKQPYNSLLTSLLILESNNSVEKGLHSLIITDKKIVRGKIFAEHFDSSFYSKELVLCKIPKGSQYYIGKNNDIASNQLILIEPLIANENSNIILESKAKNNYISSILDAYNKAIKIFSTYYKLPKYY